MEAFNAQGISAGYIDGNSTPQERLTTFQRYRTRQDKIMCNVGVLITGVDERTCGAFRTVLPPNPRSAMCRRLAVDLGWPTGSNSCWCWITAVTMGGWGW